MSTTALSDLLLDITNSEFNVERDIAYIRDSCVGPWTVWQQKNNDVRNQLQILESKVKKLKHISLEQSNEKEKQLFLEKAKQHSHQIKSFHDSLRKANLQCKMNLEKQHLKEKEILLEGGEKALQQRRQKTKQDLLKTTQRLTEDLHRIRQRMQSETERSVAALQELGRSSGLIDDTLSEHKGGVAGSIRTGKSALTKLMRRDYTDRILLMFGLFFFFSVVLYIIKVRLRLTFFGLLP